MSSVFAYAAVKAYYDRGDDYVDAFLPLALRGLYSINTGSIADLQKSIQAGYGVVIPRHSLKTILTRGSRRNYVQLSNHRYALTREGQEFAQNTQSDRAVERRLNALFDDALVFFSDREMALTVDQVRDILEEFIESNYEFFVAFSNLSSEPDQDQVDEPPLRDKYEQVVLEYCELLERSKPSLFETLKDLVFGKIIMSAVYAPSLAELDRRFDKTSIYFDTNFLFNLFDFHYEEFNEPARELFQLLRDNAFRMRAFDFTIREMVGVLRNYGRFKDQYPPDIRIDSIYSSMQEQGWTPASVREFVAALESKLEALGIEVEVTDVDTRDYAAPEGLRDALRQLKRGVQPLVSENHDLAAIEEVARLRGSRPRRIEAAEAYFLTSDAKLAQCDYEAHGHEDDGTVAEVVTDQIMTTLLWLKSPERTGDEVPIQSVIALHSRSQLINRDVWDEVFGIVRELYANGDLSGEDIGILLYDNQFQDMLRQETLEHNSKAIIDQASKAVNRLKQGFADQLHLSQEALEQGRQTFFKETHKKRVILKQVQDDAHAKYRRLEEEWFARIQKLKNQMRESSLRRSKDIVKVAIALLAVGLLAIVPLVWDDSDSLVYRVAQIGPAVGFLLAVAIDPAKYRADLERRLTNKIYKMKLKMTELDTLIPDDLAALEDPVVANDPADSR